MQTTWTPDLLPRHSPWNKDKLTGAKPPLRPKHVWAIRGKLQLEGVHALSRCSVELLPFYFHLLTETQSAD